MKIATPKPRIGFSKRMATRKAMAVKMKVRKMPVVSKTTKFSTRPVEKRPKMSMGSDIPRKKLSARESERPRYLPRKMALRGRGSARRRSMNSLEL